jgi:anthranilate phosphoribosyltransferase
MSLDKTLDRLLARRDLEEPEAFGCFEQLFSGQLSPAQAGALLFGLRSKGESPIEIAAAVRAGLAAARSLPGLVGPRIDTCGTGGDGKGSFNCSTAVALYLADMGYRVVKHGNRAVSSSCGSADVVEHLGIPLFTEPGDIPSSLSRSNFAFLFAPAFHPAFASVAPLRRELGIPTLFNLLGPLLNPARPTHQLLGVGDLRFLDTMARVLALSGIQRAAVVHGAGGFDELTPCGPARIVRVEGSRCREEVLDPADLGIARCRPDELACRDKEHSLAMMREVLAGRGPRPVLDMVALNLGLAVCLLEEELGLTDALLLAERRVRSGIGSELAHA